LKYNLPNASATSNNYTNEYSQYDYLYKKKPRTDIGNIQFTSSTSGTIYSTATYNSGAYADTGEEGMLQILKDVLTDYLIVATDYNGLANGTLIEDGVLTSAKLAFNVLSDAQVTDLTDGDETTLHKHSLASIVDTPPVTPSSFDDEFSTGSLDGKWTWHNQGTSTASVVNKRLDIDIGSMTDDICALTQSVPVGDFTMTAKLAVTSKGNSFYDSLIGLRNSANGRVLALGQADRDIGAGYIRCTKPTQADVFLSLGFGNGFIYSKVEVTGTTITLSFSKDGIVWIPVLTEDVSVWLIDITEIGIIGYRNDTTSDKAFATCEWFRVTQ